VAAELLCMGLRHAAMLAPVAREEATAGDPGGLLLPTLLLLTLLLLRLLLLLLLRTSPSGLLSSRLSVSQVRSKSCPPCCDEQTLLQSSPLQPASLLSLLSLSRSLAK
jgi:hypothetical protein